MGSVHDDRTVIWADSGEVRYFIAARSNGWFVVTASHKMGEEQFIFAAAARYLVELFFYGKCGLSVRLARGLPLLKLRRTVPDTREGYRIETSSFDGVENLSLIDRSGSAIAVTGSGAIAGTAELAALYIYIYIYIYRLTTLRIPTLPQMEGHCIHSVTLNP